MVAKLTVATTFPVHPARGGGQTRVKGLYGALAALGVEVDVVALGPPGEPSAVTTLQPGLRELRVAPSAAHAAAQRELEAAHGGVPMTDVALALHHELTPEYGAAVRRSSAGARAVVACHPYATRVLLDAAPGVPLVYEAQDVEVDVKAGILGGGGGGGLHGVVGELEALTCGEAAHVLTCSPQDGDRLCALYGVEPWRVATVPNGYDAARVRFTPWEVRTALRRSLGISGFTVLFVGSWHGPNIDAARAVVAAAAELPSARVIILGSVGAALAGDDLPANVELTGPVDDAFLQAALSIADVAVNPMSSGSGTNLKMLEYAGAGVPVIASPFGARGLGLLPGEQYVSAAPGELATALAGLAAEPPAVTRRRVNAAHEHVRATFEWRTIARGWLAREAVKELLGRRAQRPARRAAAASMSSGA